MENIDMNTNSELLCQCSKIFMVAHELCQSLLVIQAYVHGCEERIKADSLTKEELLHALSAIDTHYNVISKIVRQWVD